MKNLIRNALLLAIAFNLAMTTLLVAQGLAITGNFSSQDFRLSPGGNSVGIDAYVVVINTNDIPIRVLITTETPDGVTVIVTEHDLNLEPAEQKRLDIVVEVDPQVALGEYSIAVTAKVLHEGDGIQAVGGGRQRAVLNVVGSASSGLLVILASIGGGLVLLVGIAYWVRRRTRGVHLSDNNSQL